MSVGDLNQRFARPPCRQLLDRVAHAGGGAIGGMGFERRWHVVLSARSCRIPATPAASLLHWRIKLRCRISPLLKSRNLFICAKDLRVEADPTMWRPIAPPGNILLSKIATGLTQPSKATVIFWIADPRVTASARIVLVMSQGPLSGRGKSRWRQGCMERDTAATAVVSASFMRPGASLAIDSVATPAVMVCSASSLTVAGAAASELQTAKTCF